MKRTVLAFALILLALDASSAFAQTRGRSSQRSRYPGMDHRLEVSGHYGYVWTGSRSFQYYDSDDRLTYADLDIDDSAMWGIEIDVPVHPEGQLVLLYNRQDSDVTIKPQGFGTKETLGSIATEYWHIGGLGGVRQGNLLPFTMVTLGGTRYSALNTADDVWKFSILFGLGVKVYVNDRLALRVQGRIPYTFISGGVGFGVGTGGGSIVVGGSGIIQGDVSAGLTLLI